MGSVQVDIAGGDFNNPRMARSEAVRRVKSYSAANGYVYQFCFVEANRAELEGAAASEFVYAISADRKTTFALRILVMQNALEAWAAENGRTLTGSEEYAVAKMRLFAAFDAGEVPVTMADPTPGLLVVDGANLEAMLQALNI